MLDTQPFSCRPGASDAHQDREETKKRTMISVSETSRADAAAAAEYDEMVTGEGVIRPHWQPMIGTLRALPPRVFSDRIERARRQFEENGVTYIVHDDPRASPRPWRFDLLPLPIPASEWRHLETALAQRARLLNLVLADIYGSQRLLKEGLYPAPLVYANPRFLRACRGVAPAKDGPFLQFYAADLVRGPDQVWRVLADRADAPSGAGYALENRVVLARTLPEAFRAVPVRRLKPFFEAWQASLQALAPRHPDNPRIVLLTSGPLTETYFEHVYLARELGIPVVEGADLTVRDAKVFLKTLGGLQPVDVILRRNNSEYCDPLDLKPDSLLGVAGLVEAARAGGVAIANALGCGAVETPAIGAYLPELCRLLLAETLLMPSVESWWLGHPPHLAEALSRLPDLVIKETFPHNGTLPSFANDLDLRQRDALVDRIKAAPFAYVAQERVRCSAMPIWTTQGLDARPLVLRVYLFAHEGQYVAMPGGLTRVPVEGNQPVASMQTGGLSKDTWVLAADGADVFVPAPPPTQPLTIRRSSGQLQSRVADNLYWLGRYADRLDGDARLLRSALNRSAEGGLGPRERVELGALVRLAASRKLIDPQLADAPVDSRAIAFAFATACGPERKLHGIFSAIQTLAPTVRDRLSSDMWHVVNDLMGHARDRLIRDAGDVDRLLDGLDQLIGTVAAFGGMALENMTRHTGWRFLDLGRRIERAGFIVEAMAELSRMPTASAEAALRLALELCDSALTYRSRYLAALQASTVLDLVLADEGNPRALAYQLARAASHLDVLPHGETRPFAAPQQKLAHAALSAVRLFEIERITSFGDAQAVARLQDLLADVGRELLQLSDAITRAFFSHIKVPQSLGYGGAQP